MTAASARHAVGRGAQIWRAALKLRGRTLLTHGARAFAQRAALPGADDAAAAFQSVSSLECKEHRGLAARRGAGCGARVVRGALTFARAT